MAVPAAMGVASLPIALLAGELATAAGFLAVALVGGGMAVAAYQMESRPEISVRAALGSAAMAWLLVALLGSLPFLASALMSTHDSDAPVDVFRSPWNAVFESMSGITTTGLTLVEHPSRLPVSLVWWRSLMQWIGGAGIVLFVLAIVDPRGEGRTLFRIEGHTGNLREDVRLTARGLWKIYLALTIGGALLLWVLGMPAWWALNFAMTALATGGFSPTDGGLIGLPIELELAVSLLVILGATNFLTYANAVRGDWRKVVGDEQLRVFAVLALAGATLVYALRYFESGSRSIAQAWTQTISTLGTAGFSSADLRSWQEPALFALVLAMIVGGAAGSASGGIKVSRAWTLMTSTAAFLRRAVAQPYLFVYRPGALSRALDPKGGGHVAVAVIVLLLWLTTIAVGSLCLVFIGPRDTSLIAIVFDVTSAVSTVGLSAGVVSPALGAPAKALFIVLMWMGRLEIVPIIVLVSMLVRSRASK